MSLLEVSPEAPQVEVDNSARLLSLRDTAARVVRARHAGAEAEDLVQEAWARTAVALRDRDLDDPEAYAAAIAANLVRTHGRREACRQRWAARLFVRPHVDAPEAEVVRHEEQSAMAAALEHVPPTARSLLIAHTVQGRGTAALAAASGTTPGAVAAGLARARAILRVEYLLAFRRLPRPADRCLSILYAVSAGDVRRQARLQADRHLVACPACAPLVDALRDRRRPAVATLIALKIARWTAKLSQLDGGTLGQRAGVAGGLVSMGVAGALVLGGAAGASHHGLGGAEVQTAAAAPMRMLGTSPATTHTARRHGNRIGVPAERGRVVRANASPSGYVLRAPDPPVDPPVDTAASARVSPSGIRVSARTSHVALGAPSVATAAGLPVLTSLIIFLP